MRFSWPISVHGPVPLQVGVGGIYGVHRADAQVEQRAGIDRVVVVQADAVGMRVFGGRDAWAITDDVLRCIEVEYPPVDPLVLRDLMVDSSVEFVVV